jgi:1,4-alpha-glucan branching enzyme
MAEENKSDTMSLPTAWQQVIHGDHYDPFLVLGRHPIFESEENVRKVEVRCLVPDARAVSVQMVNPEIWLPLQQVHPSGFFTGIFPESEIPFHPRFSASFISGSEFTWIDSYSFLPLLNDYDSYLFGEGRHHCIYEKLGAHFSVVDDIPGVVFRVWAPNAKRVSVVGDFNLWDGRRHVMRTLGASGIWELFIPELKEGTIYKFELKTKSNHFILKADPYGFCAEMRPNTATIVYPLEGYEWHDATWMAQRGSRRPYEQPIAIYEVHLGSWRRPEDHPHRYMSYRELADELIPYVKELGYTHIELLPVMAHPFDASWGYQVSGYFTPTGRFGEPKDFMAFVDACHHNGLGIVLDWVPSHFPRDEHSLARFDGTCLYEHEDPRKGEHQDWGTLVFNYGRHEVRNFLIANALFWLEKYHIDGLRVDAVASMLYLDYSRPNGSWIPNEYGGRENLEAISFLRELNETLYRYHPDCFTIAEESTAWPMVSRPTYLGGLGFGFKWNMGWMHDILSYMEKDPIHRPYHHSTLTFSLLYAFHENFILSLSHDEVVHGKRSLLSKMPGDRWQQFANLRALYAYQYAHPGKKLLFMGGEFAQDWEWDQEQGLRWHLLEYPQHRQMQLLIKDLNTLYRREPVLWQIDFDPSGFKWIDFHDHQHSVVTFIRKGFHPDDLIYCVFNFTPVPRFHYQLGAPVEGFYREVFNTDSSYYGGSNLGNYGGVETKPGRFKQWPCSLTLTLPPLAGVFLKPVRQ